MLARFGYCFVQPEGSGYPPIANAHRIGPGKEVTVAGPGGPVTAMPLLQDHGDESFYREFDSPLMRQIRREAPAIRCRQRDFLAHECLPLAVILRRPDGSGQSHGP